VTRFPWQVLQLTLDSGIPIGFINRLESRLLETEDALHRLLLYVDRGTFTDSGDVQPPEQSKAHRIREWDEFPLRSMAEIRKWHEQRPGPTARIIGSSLIESLPEPGSAGEYSGPDLPVEDGSPQDVAQDRASQSEISGPSADMTTATNIGIDGSWEVSTQSSRGKAKDLMKQRPNLYF
jgi:hypothetical protein